MARIERIVASVDTFSLIVGSLSVPTRQQAEFAAEDVYDGSDPPVYLHYLVTMDESVAAEFDAALVGLAQIVKDELKRYAADCCRIREDGGFDFSGTRLRTDPATRQDLLEAQAAIAGDPNWSIPWELADGSPFSIDATSLPPVIAAVASHRRAARLIYEAVKSDIASEVIISAAQVDAAFGMHP